MAQHPPAAPSVVDRAEALMARRRDPSPPGPSVKREEEPPIPTLTDLVSGPAPAPLPGQPARPAQALPPETAPSTEPGPESATSAAPVVPAATRAAALEQAVFDRLRERLDQAISDLLDRRLVPELAASLARATEELADALRAEIPAAVEAALRNHEGPGGDDRR